MIVSHIVTLWVTVNALMIEKPPIQYLSTSIQSCTNVTFGPHIQPLDLSNRTKFAASSNDLATTTMYPVYENEDDEDDFTPSGNDQGSEIRVKETKRDRE